jgi:tRNA (cytidine32/uridine32-2'-O)-methyltransferase
MLNNIRIILIHTSHPGNIGATARAMKTMGLRKLFLVAPRLFPHVNADEMASGALDVLGQAVVVATLDEALAECGLVVGTSVRERTIPWPKLLPRAFADMARSEALKTPIAVLFGREQSGLTNQELHRCHFHLSIPSHPEYGSLNIASAVQVIAYELYLASLDKMPEPVWDYAYADMSAMTGFYEHLERVLIDIDFLNPNVPRQLIQRLKRLFNRAHPDVMELNILRGLLGAVEKKIRRS